MLHVLSRSPWLCDIDMLVSMLRAGDDLLFLQDGVLAAVRNNRLIEMFNKAPVAISALKEDVEARGLTNKISFKIALVSYADFVGLAIKHISQMNW